VLSRQEIRQQLRQRRRQLSHHDQHHASQAICQRISRSQLFRNSRRIAGFLSNDGEPDLKPLMQLAWHRKKRWHLPIIGFPNINKLWFAPYNENDPLVTNRFGIGEPDIALHDATRCYGIDLILMPLVAFDPQGNRLGMGKGYYDRTLQFLSHRSQWRKPRLVGIAYELQCFEQLPFQPWDVPLDAIVTEQRIYNINNIAL